MGKKNKSKKEGKADKKKNQKNNENNAQPESHASQVTSPVLEAQKESPPQEDVEVLSAPEVVDVPPETADIKLEEDGDQEQQPLETSEDWSIVAPHQPHVEDYESTLIQDEKHSPAGSVSGKEPGPLLELNTEEADEAFVDAQGEPDVTAEAAPEAEAEEEDPWGNFSEQKSEESENITPSNELAEPEPEHIEAPEEAHEATHEATHEETKEETPEQVDEATPEQGAAEEVTVQPTEEFPEEALEEQAKGSVGEPAEEDDWAYSAMEGPAESTENKDIPTEDQQQEEKEEELEEAPAEHQSEQELPEEATPEPLEETHQAHEEHEEHEQHEQHPEEAYSKEAEPEDAHPEDAHPEEAHPEEADPEPTEETPINHSISSPPPLAPTPAPLPSPVQSEPRSVHSPVPQPSEHPLSRHGSPLAYHAPSPYKYPSPQMQVYNPYMMGMHGPQPVHPGSVAPSSASFATAYHSPVMEHTPMASPHMYPRRPSGYPNGARDYYNGRMDRTLSGGSGHSHRMEKSNSHAEEDGHHEHHYLMGRIEKAMPDISRLLDSFKDTKNKLQAREAESRQLQAQHEQAIMHKDFYIEALQNQMKKAATETAEEYSKFKDVISGLRMELGNQQEKAKDLQEYLEASRKENEELEHLKSELETEIQTLQKKIEELQMEHDRALEEAKEHEINELATQKEELTNLFEEIRTEDETAANERYNEREKELLDEQEAMKADWEEKHDNLRTEHETAINEKHAELERNISDLEATKSDLQTVRDTLVSKSGDLEEKEKELDATKEELEANLIEIKKTQDDLHSKQEELQAAQAELQSTLDELETRKSELDDKHRELEDAHKQHSEDKERLVESHSAALDTLRDTHSTELNTLRDTHSTEVDGLRSTHETAFKEMEERFKKLSRDFTEKEKTWAAEKSTLQRHLNEKLDELASIEREKDALERDDVVREKQLQSAVDEMRRTIDNMENDREKLRKTLTSLGEATDLKTSKGDQFFVDSFNQLCRLIVDLSKEHFSYLPIDPPKDILEKIPPEMPSFLDNTAASRELRSAYIQHVVSKTLTYRIFQPFLFTLGRRYDKADTFFQVLSMDIRRKSVRREAFWRQQTLKAAYTTSDAKQSINVVAAVIVDEIVDHIKHFADPKQLDALLSGIRRIVKLAAETWRHARVERELVLATMPAPESDSDVNEGWDEYTCGRDVNGGNESNKSNGRHVLLRVFPRIYREAAHEDFADDKEKMNACTYFPGTILFADSPSVLARREEQGQKSGNSNGVNGDAARSSSP